MYSRLHWGTARCRGSLLESCTVLATRGMTLRVQETKMVSGVITGAEEGRRLCSPELEDVLPTESGLEVSALKHSRVA